MLQKMNVCLCILQGVADLTSTAHVRWSVPLTLTLLFTENKKKELNVQEN